MNQSKPLFLFPLRLGFDTQAAVPGFLIICSEPRRKQKP